MIPEVVLRLGEQTVRVDQREAVAGGQRVPLVHVAVDQHGRLVAVGRDPPPRAVLGVVDRRR
jgi:hypothetical protein